MLQQLPVREKRRFECEVFHVLLAKAVDETALLSSLSVISFEQLLFLGHNHWVHFRLRRINNSFSTYFCDYIKKRPKARICCSKQFGYSHCCIQITRGTNVYGGPPLVGNCECGVLFDSVANRQRGAFYSPSPLIWTIKLKVRVAMVQKSGVSRKEGTTVQRVPQPTARAGARQLRRRGNCRCLLGSLGVSWSRPWWERAANRASLFVSWPIECCWSSHPLKRTD